mmetsp:Transcript_38647/g.79262  ORF Transcript_38647/g.79262 Transcript_38647/m.79262 type:complete len:98 (+) Transcript_38647:786-1079(+)
MKACHKNNTSIQRLCPHHQHFDPYDGGNLLIRLHWAEFTSTDWLSAEALKTNRPINEFSHTSISSGSTASVPITGPIIAGMFFPRRCKALRRDCGIH